MRSGSSKTVNYFVLSFLKKDANNDTTFNHVCYVFFVGLEDLKIK